MLTDQAKNSIQFIGQTDEIETYISKCLLYLHCSRGDAFPTVVLEAMAAGLVPLISTETGTLEIVRKMDEDYILPLDPDTISNKIVSFFELSTAEKKRLSMRSKNAVSDFSEERAIYNFKTTFETMMKEVVVH